MTDYKPTFSEDLANLVQPTITAALQSNDKAATAEIIEALTSTLARVIARSHFPDTGAIDQAINLCATQMAEESTALVGSLKFIEKIKARAEV